MMRKHPSQYVVRVAPALLLCLGSARLLAADPEPSTPDEAQTVTLIKTPTSPSI